MRMRCLRSPPTVPASTSFNWVDPTTANGRRTSAIARFADGWSVDGGAESAPFCWAEGKCYEKMGIYENGRAQIFGQSQAPNDKKIFFKEAAKKTHRGTKYYFFCPPAEKNFFLPLQLGHFEKRTENGPEKSNRARKIEKKKPTKVRVIVFFYHYTTQFFKGLDNFKKNQRRQGVSHLFFYP